MLEQVLKHALAMMASTPFSITKGSPMSTTDAIRGEFGVQSVEATMAGQAVRSRVKYKASPALSAGLSSPGRRQEPSQAHGQAQWNAMRGKLSKWLGITTAAAEWKHQPAYGRSEAKDSTATMGEFPAHVIEAAKGGPINAATFAAADPGTSKTKGRRMRVLANEHE